MSSNNIKNSLSAARMATYDAFVGGFPSQAQSEKALSLYMWNAQVSSAFLVPLHICEIVTRNAISDVLETVYGPRWPWSAGFERSLPTPTKGYKPRDDLINARKNQHITGKVIAELKFVFWQKMLTGRFDDRLWNRYLFTAFPNAVESGLTARILREGLYDDLETLRRLRNRIAHHEPIMTRNLIEDFSILGKIIAYRCVATKDWMQSNQMLLPLLTLRPVYS